MAKLISVKLETCHANSDGVAWYAYFEGDPTEDELTVEAVFEDEEVPDRLSKHAGLRRYFVSPAV